VPTRYEGFKFGSVVGQVMPRGEVRRQQRSQALLTAANLEGLLIGRVRPLEGDRILSKYLIERYPVTVTFGVGENTVAIKNQSLHVEITLELPNSWI
jgi:hypothetical protein